MPERGFATETWDSDEWFQELSERQRYLFIYLWTNSHCNQAGLYHITLSTVSFATKIPKNELPDLINSLSPKVKWWPEDNLIWVQNFIKRQSKSSKFLAAAAKSLTTITNNKAIQELLDYNQRRYSISIPYGYYIDKISILTRVSASVPDTVPVSAPRESSLFSDSLFSLDELNTVLEQLPPAVDRLAEHEAIKQMIADVGLRKGYIVLSEYATEKGRIDLCWLDRNDAVVAAFEIDFRTPRDKSLEKLGALRCANACVILRSNQQPTRVKLEQIPRSSLETEETLCEGDQEIISVWSSVKGVDMSPADASALVTRLRTEFPDVDILAESKAWAARKISEPLLKGSRPSQQIWNWMRKAREFSAERRQREQGKDTRPKVHPREAYRSRGW